VLFDKIHSLKTDLYNNDVTLLKNADEDPTWPLLEKRLVGLTVK